MHYTCFTSISKVYMFSQIIYCILSSMYIAVDLGGTKTLVVLFSANKEILGQVKFETPQNYEEFKDNLVKARDEINPGEAPIAGAVGSRGLIDRENGLMIVDSVLPWQNAQLVKDCQDVFGCQFTLDNDSKLAGLSEARLSDGNYPRVLYITISTGIGSALIINGRLSQDVIDSEIGKWVFNRGDGVVTWEDFASGHWITDTYGMRASELNDETAWQEISKNLAIGFANSIITFSPDLIIIGGGVGTHSAKYKDKLTDEIEAILPDGFKVPEISQAKYPEEAVVYGCYELIQK